MYASISRGGLTDISCGSTIVQSELPVMVGHERTAWMRVVREIPLGTGLTGCHRRWRRGQSKGKTGEREHDLGTLDPPQTKKPLSRP